MQMSLVVSVVGRPPTSRQIPGYGVSVPTQDHLPGVCPLPGHKSKTSDSLWHPPPSPCSPEHALAPRVPWAPEFIISIGSTAAQTDPKLLRSRVKNDTTGSIQGSSFAAMTFSCNKASFPSLPSHCDVAPPWGRSPSQDLGRPNQSLPGEAKTSIKKFNLQTHA